MSHPMCDGTVFAHGDTVTSRAGIFQTFGRETNGAVGLAIPHRDHVDVGVYLVEFNLF